ncbi:unnamed protein product [Urochloa humidicola]
MSSTTASNLWFSDLAAAVQGTWQAVAAGHGGQQQRKLLRTGGPGGEPTQKQKAAGAASAGREATEDADGVGRCGGAMSDTTVYLLLDRFAPS